MKHAARAAFGLTDRASLVVLLVVIALPPLLTTYLSYRYAVDVPTMDHWSMVSDLEKFHEGTWTFDDVMRSHNGHRIAVGRLLLVPLAFATGWDTRVEIGLSHLTAGGILLILVLGFSRLFTPRDSSAFLLAVAGASVAVFGLSQWENWLWGLQFIVFSAVLFSLASLLALSHRGRRWTGWAAAVVLGILASFSQGPGLVVWPVGACVLALRRHQPSRRPKRIRAMQLAGWLLVAGGVLAFYLSNRPGDGGAGSVSSYFLEQPLGYLSFVLTVLGAPVASFSSASWPPGVSITAPLAGLALLGLTVLLWLRLWRRRPTDRDALVFVGSVLVFGVGVAAQIGLGRAQMGSEVAMSSRYVTLIAPAWAGLMALVCVSMRSEEGATRRAGRPGGATGVTAKAAVVVAAVLYAGLWLSSIYALTYFPGRNARLEPARQALADGGPRDMLARLHPEVVQVGNGAPVLRRLRLSVFRGLQPSPNLEAGSPSSGASDNS